MRANDGRCSLSQFKMSFIFFLPVFFFFFYHLNDELSLLRDFWLITEVCVDLMDIQEVFRNKGNVCSRSEASG